MDLAILQIVNEADLPPPLPIRPANELVELDKLVCLGFPGGRRLADRNRSTLPPRITVTESNVSALRNDDGGNLYSVQMQGGVVHGNSGGPVCDTDGNVIGVAVRVDIDHRGERTNIAFAVPSEYVVGLLAGRAAEGVIGQGYLKGDRVVYPITVRCADPLNKLKGIGVGVWVGEKGTGPRPPGDAHKEEKGDVGYREIPLAYDRTRKVATGEIDFPRDTDGRAYWVRPFYTNTLMPKRYLAGTPLPAEESPVERTPVDLSARLSAGAEFSLTIDHVVKATQKRDGDGGEVIVPVTLRQQLKLRERVERPRKATDHALLEHVMKNDAAKIEVSVGGEKPTMTKELLDAKDTLSQYVGLVAVGRDGKTSGVTVVQGGQSSATDPIKKDIVNRLAQQWAATAGESTLKLPGKSVNVGDTWTDTLSHRIKLAPELLVTAPKDAVIGTMKEEVTYTYLGRRDRAGRGEAVIRVEGVLHPIGSDTLTCGNVEGRAVIDERTGLVLEIALRREFDLEVKLNSVMVRASGTEVVKVLREK
ncbi:MAG: serine protease [Fimbriiglobus sp.]|nr:serine protease [Fimbriiglobus sp.]